MLDDVVRLPAPRFARKRCLAATLTLLAAGLNLAASPPPSVPPSATPSATPSAEPSAQPTSPAASQPAANPPMTLSQRVGIDAAKEQLGDQLPTGRGIVVGHVEAEKENQYAPNTQDALFSGVTFEYQSGPGRPSGHAQATAAVIYGPSGLAPGISRVKLFSTNHWLTHGGLNSGSLKPPMSHGCRVINHSWIATGRQPALIHALRRADALVDRQNVILVVGVNNGETSSVPVLMASAYNAIAVGQVDGRSSGGYTQVEIAGRCKPDLVAPGNLTSISTPVVTAVVARLLEAADRHPSPNAQKAQVIRAVLMTGAEKPARWQPEPGKPLDRHLGAGMVRLDRSLAILMSSGHASREACSSDQPKETPKNQEPNDGDERGKGGEGEEGGWEMSDYLPGATPKEFPFTIDRDGSSATATLCWNRRIDGRIIKQPFTEQSIWSDAPRMAHFELRLWRLGNQTRQLIAESFSPIDNVQHIHATNLPAGKYVWQVARVDALGEPWDAALAWLTPPPKPP